MVSSAKTTRIWELPSDFHESNVKKGDKQIANQQELCRYHTSMFPDILDSGQTGPF